MSETVQLGKMTKGQAGTIARVTGRPEVSRRIREMGVVPGSAILVEERAPLGDPIEVLILGYHLTLRAEEANSIEVRLNP